MELTTASHTFTGIRISEPSLKSKKDRTQGSKDLWFKCWNGASNNSEIKNYKEFIKELQNMITISNTGALGARGTAQTGTL